MFSARRWKYGLLLAATILAGGGILLGVGLSSSAAPRSSDAQFGSQTGRRPASTTISPTAEQQGKKPSERAPDSTRTIFAPCGSPTPCNQDALDSILESAEKTAGHRYFTAGVIDANTNSARLYLVTWTPRSVIEKIEATYPSVRVIHLAEHSLYELKKLEGEVAVDAPELKASGVIVRSIGTAPDGRLVIGVAGHLGTATEILESRYGADWIRVVKADVIQF